MAGDYTEKLVNNADLSTAATYTAAATGANALVTVRGTQHRLNIQRIAVAPTTYAASTITFRATDATGAVVGFFNIPAAAPTGSIPGEQLYVMTFGPRGFPMASGANLVFVPSATGSAGNIVVDVYQQPVGTVAIGTGN